MSRLALTAFTALAVATVAAFFVTQHLKVTTPLIAGLGRPNPETISPAGTGCGGARRLSRFSFYLLHRSDQVAVYVVDSGGTIVRTLASNRHMRRRVRYPDGSFLWDGRRDDGRIASDGDYHFRIALLGQGRTVEAPLPVIVQSTPPRPVVTDVTPALVPAGGGSSVSIRIRGNERYRSLVRLYRTDLPDGPRLVKSFRTRGNGSTATWDGKIAQRPAPAGIYLVGLEVTDKACNTGRFPASLPPQRGSTPHAGVTVRYLAVQPPLAPVPAGSDADVLVDSRRQPYSWALQRAGAAQALVHGSSTAVMLRVPLPPGGPGLFLLTARSGAHATTVPVVASGSGRSGREPPILVVLPALTWQGLNRVDDNGDGLPNTLDAGGPVKLARVLAGGLPAGWVDEQGLLGYLDRSRLAYQLTTDLGLIDGIGPSLAGHAGVVLAGSERWLTPALSASLRAYVHGGGHVVSLGLDSLRRQVDVNAGQAINPTAPAGADIFGARPGVVAGTRDLITVSRDELGLFTGTSGALPGWRAYQPLNPAPGITFTTAAGVGGAAAAVAGFHYGSGVVVEIGLPGFGHSLAGNVDAQELIANLWRVIGR